MNYAKRMVVVPKQFLSSMEHRWNVESSPITQKLTALDGEIEAILGHKDVSDHEKEELYNQILQRYLNYYEKKKDYSLSVKVINKSSENTNSEDDAEDNSHAMEQEVLHTVPKTTRSGA